MKINDLIPKLLEATGKKKLTWTQVMDQTFVTRMKERKFRVAQGYDEDSGEPFYRFDIYASKTDAQYEGHFLDGVYADRFKGPYSDLEELYAEVRRNALGLDDVMSAIDDELDNLLM